MSVRAGLVAIGVPAARAAAEAPAAGKAMLERAITTQPRAAMFLAQVCEESGDLQWFEELASGSEYEGRCQDLGNCHPGDGVRYKGRGPIQLTGRANYRWAGNQLGLPLEAHPELAARHDVGWRIAALYWQSHGLNELADQGAFLTITKRINGGTNGYSVRLGNLDRAKRVDCRPAPADPFAGYPQHERYLLRTYDHLKATNAGAKRRAELHQEMTVARKVIWRAAQPRSNGGDGHGWHFRQRAARYASLQARTR